MYNHKLYIIECKTPLHVGSGETNFGIIDNKIQRDPLTTYPTIHASSLKGALREYCSFRHPKEDGERFLPYIFGNEEQSGAIRFTQAYLLSLPFRAENNPYYMCTSPEAIAQLLDTLQTFSLPQIEALKEVAAYNGEEIVVSTEDTTIEDIRAKKSDAFDFETLEKIIGSPLAIVPNEKFRELLEDLPVIARNQLENGGSKNLWYEEILPRKSKLFTLISEPTYLNDKDEKRLQNAFERFHDYLCDENTIHIGANASVGYGVTTFKELSYES
ncbi:CRISPR-associated RAMP Cmr4 [hydrothermal vent metagenome]|uniref:CRISPR-associated RAMP Cmr4 n=1 Tax=hydrothermal vent metagenome TaxID=652676 RepID=A0A1W1BER9_9ZZZZ